MIIPPRSSWISLAYLLSEGRWASADTPASGAGSNLLIMDKVDDGNAAIWQSGQIAATWTAEAGRREREDVPRQRFMAALLPFGEQDALTFLDLGSRTCASSPGVTSGACCTKARSFAYRFSLARPVLPGTIAW